jgi:hypothetical protein
MLARAPRHGFGFGDFCFLGSKSRAFVGAVAEGLCLGFPTRAPPKLARLGFLDDGRFLKNGWFVHNSLIVSEGAPDFKPSNLVRVRAEICI